MADKVTWFELPAFDVKRAGAFYKDVFGWEGSDMGGGSLAVTSSETDEELTPLERGSISGDISPLSEGFDKPLIVITVENVDKKVEMVKQAGGIVVLEPKLIEEMGMIWSIVQDTEGNRVGIIQTA
ncbi:MAG TPA: VOC family protein [Candidatus Saccharimonadales bacterium]